MNMVGKSPNLDYDIAGLTLDEKNIMNVFHKDWYVTFAKKQQWKGVTYGFVFARPNEELSRKFRLNRNLETLIIFIESSFNDRTPDFVDRLMEGSGTSGEKSETSDNKIGIFKNRLDPRKIILISKDNETHQKVEKYLISHPQGRIFVPYTYQEFLQEPSSNAWEKLKKLTYGRDLFAYEQPLVSNDIYFFGRENFIAELANRCESGLNSGVFGLRRTGKTSVLYALERKLRADESGVSFYFACYKPDFYKARWWEVLQLIAKTILKDSSPVNYGEKSAGKSFRLDLSGSS